jgi:hypothetical protein
MYKEILTENQHKLLPFVARFKKNFYLAGGTAVALQIGHRRSIDFDLFTEGSSLNLNNIKLKYKEERSGKKKILYESFDQLHVQIEDVKFTFFSFPYKINTEIFFNKTIRMPDLLSLSAMKAFALGGRAKWKDYVDLYFIIKHFHTLKQIAGKAEEIFESSFSEKLLRQQLTYFDDIDYSEEVEFIGDKIPNGEIQTFLKEKALANF